MKPGKIILLITGSLIALVGFGLLAAGASLGWATATQRDDAGFFTTPNERFTSDSYAITSDELDLGNPGPDDWWADRDLATLRISAASATGDDLFVGIGPQGDVEVYLAGVPHDEITDVDFGPFSANYRREHRGGAETPTRPADETFWVAQRSGAGPQTITWDLEPGNWAIVVMNADATANVGADIEVGGRVGYLVPIAIGLGIGGVVIVAIGTAMIIAGAMQRRSVAGEPDLEQHDPPDPPDLDHRQPEPGATLPPPTAADRSSRV